MQILNITAADPTRKHANRQHRKRLVRQWNNERNYRHIGHWHAVGLHQAPGPTHQREHIS